MSSTDQNKAIVRECYQAAAGADTERLREILSDDFVIHAPDDHHGVDGLLEMVAPFKTAVPDMKVTIDAQFADGDYVTTRFRAQGAHHGELFGTPPTGREVTVHGITLSRCSGGRIAEEWELVDAVGLLGQVGALPALTET